MIGNLDQNKEIMEMLQYLVKTLGGVDERVTSLDKKVTDIDGRLKYVEQNMVTKAEFTDLTERVDAIDERTGAIFTLLDNDAAKSSENEMEIAAAHHKLERHESWIHTIADNVGVALSA